MAVKADWDASKRRFEAWWNGSADDRVLLQVIAPKEAESKPAAPPASPEQRWLDALTVAEAEALLAAGQFPAGSMAPKIEAIIDFLRRRPTAAAVITSPEAMRRALHHETGTWITATSATRPTPEP